MTIEQSGAKWSRAGVGFCAGEVSDGQGEGQAVRDGWQVLVSPGDEYTDVIFLSDDPGTTECLQPREALTGYRSSSRVVLELVLHTTFHATYFLDSHPVVLL